MHELITVEEQDLPRTPTLVALETDAPTPSQLFRFMAEAELRFESLRMRILDATFGTDGEADEVIEVALRHPGHARIVTRPVEVGLDRQYRLWVTDGAVVKTLDGRAGTGSVRPVRPRPEGLADPDLPSYSRVWMPRTQLPHDSLPEAFIHPRGFCRNVLATGIVSLLGGTTLAGDRASILLRSDHPRTSHLLTDRPDHWLEVGVDRMTGLILLLVEHVGDRATRHAAVTDLELDAVLPDETFTVHYSSDSRLLY